jgi:hypothetical protein
MRSLASTIPRVILPSSLIKRFNCATDVVIDARTEKRTLSPSMRHQSSCVGSGMEVKRKGDCVRCGASMWRIYNSNRRSTFRLLRPFRHNKYPFAVCPCFFAVPPPSPTDVRSRELSTVLSRSCTSLSDVRETCSWPSDFLYSWSSSSSAPFCTCATSSHYVGLTHHNRVKVFYRARYMGQHP